MNMGNVVNFFRGPDPSEDSESEDETDVGLLRANRYRNMQTDAIGRVSRERWEPAAINRSIVDDCEEELTRAEKISLIYLLIDDVDYSLNLMAEVIDGKSFSIIGKFLDGEPDNQEKVIEALTVIQNFSILKKLGNAKQALIEKFCPFNKHISCKIQRKKKFLYRLFEDLDKPSMEQFFFKIEKDFMSKNLFLPNFKYLEYQFTYFEKVDYVKNNDFSSVIKIMKTVNFDFYDDLVRQYPIGDGYDQMITDEPEPQIIDNVYSTVSNSTVSRSADSCYDINPAMPGFMLIIENENFYNLPDYKNVALSYTEKISDRIGTKYDSDKLKETFKRLGYSVLHVRDKKHDEILRVIEDSINNRVTAETSSFFLCLLSHGLEGKIISTNSVPVDVEDIKRKMYHPKLDGKPKVLILQSCQGEKTIAMDTEVKRPMGDITTDFLTTDSPTTSVRAPRETDLLEIWSTIPGFASIRDVRHGSWFIQTLCEVIDEHYRKKDLLSMCTIVQNKISNMKWNYEDEAIKEVRVMVPETKHKLRKDFYLTRQH